ncbi:hypothetical protein VST7929_00675 [Vibrio stylophorae]|uniref:HlyD family secretion protein n=1 Tax=Vibrio stylophorae TaxID=659351 RepID=A0ABM8ZRA2_9VIBR|nr:HlyD family efflux transporter periplasmic adaptor subunit [Vibrio stylophorae]CAH0532828.1 hypothetical protein VST7929_00675 [Vibrio stylophorae]
MKVEFHLDKQNDPTRDQGTKVAYGQAKRGGYRLRWYLLLGLILSPILVLLYFFYRNFVLVIAPGIVSSEPLVLRATHDAVVVSMLDKSITQVKPQELLLNLKNEVLTAEVGYLQRELDGLKGDKEHSTAVDLQLFKQAIYEARANLRSVEKLKKQYDSYKKQGSVSSLDYSAMLNMYASAKQGLKQAQIDYDRAVSENTRVKVAGPIIQERRQLRQQLVRKQAEMASLQVYSPVAGFVVERLVVKGQRVRTGDPLIAITTLEQPKVIAYLDAKYLKDAVVGNQVTVIFPDGERFAAYVSEPTEVASKLPSQLAKPFEGSPALLRVTLTLEKPLTWGRWVEGMPVEVQF